MGEVSGIAKRDVINSKLSFPHLGPLCKSGFLFVISKGKAELRGLPPNTLVLDGTPQGAKSLRLSSSCYSTEEVSSFYTPFVLPRYASPSPYTRVQRERHTYTYTRHTGCHLGVTLYPGCKCIWPDSPLS